LAGRSRELKNWILGLFRSGDIDRAVSQVREVPARRVVNPLFSLLLSTEPRVKWGAVTAMGAVVPELADQDMESSRVIMRRLMWQLNDESGGIGWGCPETMGEITANHRDLAREYGSILVSYIREDGNYLEYPPLQAGAVWGIARLAGAHPDLAGGAVPHLWGFMESPDPVLRGLTAWCLGLLGPSEAASVLRPFLDDPSEIEIYRGRRLIVKTVGELAAEALKNLSEKP